MDSLEARITARAVGIDRLNRYTVWIGVVAMGAVAAFAVIAAATIPGKASSIQRAGSSASANASTSTGDPVTYHHHDDFGNSSSISASSGPPIAVSGASR